MAQQFFGILTAIGESKDANAKALGLPLVLTELAVGDGNGNVPTPDRMRPTLVNEVRRAPINQISVDPDNLNQIVIEQVIPENVGGWWIREMGLYDEDGDLIAICNCPPSYKPKLIEGSGRTQVVRMVLIFSSTATVQLKVDPSVVLATRKYADGAIAAHESAADPHQQYATKVGVQRALGNIQGLTVTSATPYDMKTAQLGSAIYFCTGSSVFNLPDMTGMPVGSMVYLSANVTITVNAHTGQLIDDRSNGGIASITMASQDDLFLAWTGTAWLAIGGSFVLRSGSRMPDALFGISKGVQGYQRLPSGLIIQWGTGVGSGSGASIQLASVTFPIAFPNGVFSVAPCVTGIANSSAGAVPTISTYSWSMDSFLLRMDTLAYTTFNQSCGYSWIAIGY